MQPEDNFYSSSDGPFCLWTASVDGCMEIQLDGIKGIRKQSDRGLLCIWKYIWCRKERHAVYSVSLDSSSLQPTLPPLSSKPANCVWGSKRVSVPWTAPALGLPLTVPLPFFPSNTEELFIQHLVPQTFQHYPQCLCEWMQVCVADMVCTLSLLLVELHTAPYITTAAQDSCDGLEVRTCVCVLNCTHYNYDLFFFSLCQPF